jgi:hypothetical protein
MEKFEQPKRESGFSKVVGATPEEEKEILEKVKKIFKDQPVESFEKEKSPEEFEIIKSTLEKMPEFVERYGGAPVPLRPEHIHILDVGQLDEERKKEMEKSKEGGFYLPNHQSIGIFSHESKLKEAERIVHEALHFNSFQSGTLKKPEGLSALRRIGVRVFSEDNKEIYFYDIDEAVIAELERRFDQEYFESISPLAEEIERRKEFVADHLKRYPEDAEDVKEIALVQTKRLESGLCKTTVETYPYPDEREKLNRIIDDIYQRNKDKFSSKEDVFNIFARAVLTGRLLKVARLIEQTFGKGSFRKIAEETKKQE